MKKLTTIAAALMLLTSATMAQRTTDKLDRGLVAMPAASGNGTFVSWKIFGEEYYDTKYNLYRDGVKVNNEPISVSNYSDAGGKSTSKYQVAAVVRGKEQEKCAEVTRWSAQYKDISIKGVSNRNGKDVTSKYEINDVSLGDVTGDGITELIIKRNNTGGDILDASNKTDFNLYECYTLKGERLWWIDLGPNLMAEADEQWDLVAFDWDQDGKAECLMRGADNMIIHTAKGKVINIGKMNYYAPRNSFTNEGAEYLLYLNGETGEPYGWNGEENWTPMAYPLPRYEQSETTDLLGSSAEGSIWGAGILGHRCTKHYFGAPFLDGRKASIFLGRGCYTRHKFCALDVNPETHELTQRWRWNEYNSSSPYFGQGFHNFQIADVDWDGRDEIMFGSMVIDDNGKGLCTTGLGHGDAQHCSDLDPYRHGQEQFTCNESSPACTYWNATTGQIYYRLQSTSDDGRALAGNFSNSFPGSMGRTTQTGLVSCVADKVISSGGPATEGTNDALYWSHLNQRIYWDGDLCDEVFDSPGSNARSGAIYKPGGGRLITMDGTNTANSSKNNPGAIADILGDWREEVVMRNGTQGSKTIRIFTTNTPTNYGIYTLWHDHQYRNAMVWQCMGYNQPPHKSYFIGEMEGITQAPPPLTMTGRREIANGGTITTTDEHLIVCETNNTEITIAEGAEPYIVTFNVPSWVQGTNSTIKNGGAKINYEYYTCDVKGGYLAGSARLVKQGDGILKLPKTTMKHTGETNVWAGTLAFDGTLESSPLWLNRFAELNSDGGQFLGGIRMDYDAKLRPGGAEHQGTVTASTIEMGFGSRIVFDLYSEGLAADKITTSTLSIETKKWNYGPKYLTPVFEFVAHNNGEMTTGRYLIGEIGEVKGNLSDIRIEGMDNKMKSQLVLEDGKLYLEVSSIRSAASVVWTGNESAVWELAGAENFVNAALESDIFVTGDNVRFDDTASKLTVTLNGDIEADTVFVDNTKGYSFSGTGALIGNTTLVKQGTGTLTIKNDNKYTGGNRLSGGVVSISSLANANQATGNLGAVTTTASKFVMENGAELRATAAVTNGSPIKLEGDGGGVINNTADFVVDKAMSGTVLTKKGAGWMKLNVSNSSLNRLVIVAGTVQCVNANTPAKTVEYQGGTLNENAGTTYAIDVAKGKSGTWNLVNDATYSNKVSGEGTLTVSCPVRSGGSGSSKWYATRTQIACDFSAFEGTLKPTSNGDPDGRFTLNTNKGMPKGTMNIAAGVQVQNSGKIFRIGKLSGAGSLGGSCTFSNGASVGANTWQVGNEEDWTTSVKVTSNANLTKMGTGKVTWNSVNDNTGATTINEGELKLGTNAQLGTGKLTVAQNGTLTFLSKPKALANSAVTFNGTLSIEIATGHNLQAGDSIVLWTTKTFSGTPVLKSTVINAEKGLYWDTRDLNKGILRVSDDATLGIRNISADSSRALIFTLDGKYAGNDASLLKKGVYIRKGKKIVIK